MSERASERSKPRPEGSDLRTLARGGTLNLVGAIASGVLGFVLALIVTRGLGPGGTGIFYAAVALFTILANATELGADTGLVRAITRYRALGRVHDIRPTLGFALWPVLGAGTLAAAAVWVLATPLAKVVNHGVANAEIVEYVRVLSPFLVVASLSTTSVSASRGFGTMVPYVAVESIGKPAARVLLVGAAVVLGMGRAAIVVAWAAPVLAGAMIGIAVILGQARRAGATVELAAAPEERVSRRALATEFWRFTAARGVAGVFQISVIWLDILLVSFLTDRTQTGVYSAASRLVTVGTFALQAMRLAIAPQVGELLAGRRRERAESLYQVATWWLMAVSWPLYLLLAVFAPFVLGIFGAGFRQGQTALMILSLAMLVNLGTGNVTVVLLMAGKSSWNLLNTAGALTINVGLNLILVPRFGIEGAAVAWTASIAFDNLAALIEVRKFLGLRPFGVGYAVVAGGAVVCFGLLGVASRALLGDGGVAVLAVLVVGGGVYVSLLWRARKMLHFAAVADVFRARWVRGEAPKGGVSKASVIDRSPVARAVRGAVKKGLRGWGVLTSASRPLPDFLVIGAKRGGTTSLYSYLQQHPNVAPLFPAAQRVKGVDFFDMNFAKGERWYRSFFPSQRARRKAERRLGAAVVVGEASPYYIFHPLAARRAAEVAPGARIIVLLRDPVDRAYSHYRERVRHGAETLTFEEAIAAEPERLAGEADRLVADPSYHSFAHENFSYVTQGRYAGQLEAWFERFPRDRILILRSEDLFADPARAYGRTLGFLGLSPHHLEEYEAFNYHPGRGIDPDTHRRLAELFAPEVERLERLLDMDLGWHIPAPG